MSVHSSVWKNAPTLFQHMCQLDFTKESPRRRMVGIIATIGASSRNVQTIYEMLKAGMNIARLNFAYETPAEHSLSVNCLREAVQLYSQDLGYNFPLGLAGDLKGRAILTGTFQTSKYVDLKPGDVLKLTVNELMADKCSKEAVYVDYPGILQDAQLGQRIILGENDLELDVIEIGLDVLFCRVIRGGQLNNRVSVALPGVGLSMPPLTEKDQLDIEFCIKHNFDFLFISKVRQATDIEEVRRKLGLHQKQLKILTKLENEEAFVNLDQIIKVSDGVIIARADMCVELPMEKIFIAQKAITARCNRLGQPVVVANQLLMSMRASAVPQRSDLSDIATALIDGADSLLLSSETAVGKYPIEALKVLAKTCREAEIVIWQRKFFEQMCANNPAATDGAHAVAITAVSTSLNVMATAIVVITVSGRSAQLISAYRPRCPIFAVTRCMHVARKSQLCRGIIPVLVPSSKTTDNVRSVEERINYALTVANHMGIVHSGDAVVVLSPWNQSAGFNNNVHIIYANFEKTINDCFVDRTHRAPKDTVQTKKYFRF